MKKEELDIKQEYDFSNAKNIKEFENGKYFFRIEEMEVPIYLNRKVFDNLEKLAKKENTSISKLINKMYKHYSLKKNGKISADLKVKRKIKNSATKINKKAIVR